VKRWLRFIVPEDAMDSARYAYAVIGIALIVGGCGGGGTVFAL